jgi:hypothetical protein
LPTIPDTSADGRLSFRLNMPVQEIRVISGFARPADFGCSDDRRHLGVALYGLRWQQGEATIEVPIGSPGFIDGFHHVEQDQSDLAPFRWTNGNAALPPTIFPPWQGETLLHLRLKGWHGTMDVAPIREAAEILHAFDSLGTNCELALAQRHFGVELPLSLLRWSGTSYEKLLRGLESRFAGLGDPETTAVVWDATDYRLKTPYLNMHTTTIEPQNEAGIADILHCGCATLRLLRRKLLKDIADARRIFVFRSADPSFGQAEMRRLYTALRSIGPASLLCLTLKGSGRSGPAVERLADGLYAGHLEKFVIPDGPFDEWLELCSRTLTLDRTK